MALDVLDYSNFSTGGDPVTSQVWTLNLESQVSTLVADTGIATANDETVGVWGVPSFWGDDDYITMQRFDILSQSESNGEVYRIPIDASWAGDDTNRKKINDFDAAMPIMHRAGARNMSGTLTPSATLLDFGNVNLGQSTTKTLTLTNSGNKDLSITNLSLPGNTYSQNGTNTSLPRTQSMSITITFTPGTTAGTQNGTLTITSNADTPTLVISLTGTGVDPYPVSPSDLLATAISSNQIDLNWTDKSSGEIGFMIERKTGSAGTYSQIDTVSADVTTYSDTGLSEATIYYYRVRAYNSAGNSIYSSEASATTSSPSGGGGGGGGCFIATAAYGSRTAKEVNILKNFRDNVLLTNSIGRNLVKLYYNVSPPMADFIAKHDNLRALVRVSLLPVVGASWVVLKIGPLYSLALMLLLCSVLIGFVGFRRKF
ncbi:CFI-box-CTERM domain-containing protein [Thermodesulfobacteriota bacterium]